MRSLMRVIKFALLQLLLLLILYIFSFSKTKLRHTLPKHEFVFFLFIYLSTFSFKTKLQHILLWYGFVFFPLTHLSVFYLYFFLWLGPTVLNISLTFSSFIFQSLTTITNSSCVETAFIVILVHLSTYVQN